MKAGETMRIVIRVALIALAVSGCDEQNEGVRLSSLGYDAEDSSAIIQQTLDSKLKKIVFDKTKGPWIVSRTIKCPSDKEIVFEEGAELVAKRGCFMGVRDYLFLVSDCTNVVIRGLGEKGGVFRMHKKDYQKPPYPRSEWRYTLRICGAENVVVSNMTFRSSGGDGIVVGRSPASNNASKNVRILKCVCDDNHRQGISVCAADGLLIEDTVLSNTRGTPPQAGIDFEPDHPGEPMSNLVMRRCKSINNAGNGYEFFFNALKAHSKPVSVLIEDCESVGCQCSASVISSLGAAEKDFVTGRVAFRNCTFRDANGQGIMIAGKPECGFDLSFDGCTVDGAKAGWLGADVAMRNMNREQPCNGGIAFNDLKIVQRGKKHDWFTYAQRSIYAKASEKITGRVELTGVDGKVTDICLNADWRRQALPGGNANAKSALPRKATDFAKLAVVDRHPGEMRTLSRVGLFHGFNYVFYADKPMAVRFKARQFAKEKSLPQPEQREMKVFDVKSGKAVAKLKKPGFETEEISVKVGKPGFYEIKDAVWQSYLMIEAATVPVAISTRNASAFVLSPEKQLFSVYLNAPEAAQLYVAGSDVSAGFCGKLISPDGKLVREMPSVHEWDVLSLAAAPGLYRFDVSAAKGRQYWLLKLDLVGTDGFLFLDGDRYWGVPATGGMK